MGRGVNPAPHQHLGSMGQKGHPQYTSGHKHETTFASRGQRNVNGNDPACCDCSVCPVFLLSSLGEGGKEGKKKKKNPTWFMRAGSFVCLNNEPTAGPATAPRPRTIASVCALLPARSAISWVHLSQQYAVMMARVKYHLHGGTKGQYNFIWGQTAGLYNSSFHRAFSFHCVPLKKLFLVS